MAIASVQAAKNIGGSSVSTFGVTFGSNTTTGNTITMSVGWATGTATSIATVTDSQSNTYTLRSTTSKLEVWIADNITGGTTPTVTITTVGTLRPNMLIAEFSGLSSPSFDQEVASSGSSATLAGGTTGTTAVADELVYMVGRQSANSGTMTAGSGFIGMDFQTSVGNGTKCGTQYSIVSSIGTQTGSITSSTSASYATEIITLKGAAVASAALTGTITSSITESDIVTGGKTIILTITGDTFIAAGGLSFDLIRQDIINGLTSAQSETLGWNLVVKALQGVSGVVRTSSTVVTITLDAFATYNITATETITATIPASALTGAVAIVASPTFTVTATGGANNNASLLVLGV